MGVIMVDEKCKVCLQERGINYAQYFDKIILLPQLEALKSCLCQSGDMKINKIEIT
jgi:hypothetical protein